MTLKSHNTLRDAATMTDTALEGISQGGSETVITFRRPQVIIPVPTLPLIFNMCSPEYLTAN